MQVEILTPDAHVFTGEVDVLTLTGADGSFQILDDHAPMIALLAKGPIDVKTRSGQQHFNAMGGVVEVANNKVAVLAEGIAR